MTSEEHRPASEESWFCPSCGKPARAFVSFHRIIVCDSCSWTFDISLWKSFNSLKNPLDDAKAHAEQIGHSEKT